MTKDGDQTVQDWNEILRFKSERAKRYLEFWAMHFMPRTEALCDYQQLVDEMRN